MAKNKKKGKGIIFSDLIYVLNAEKTKPKIKTDKKGNRFTSFSFIIDNGMGFANCTYYGDKELKGGECLKLLKGRWCPYTTATGYTFQNIYVEDFEIWQQNKQEQTNIIDTMEDNKPKSPEEELFGVGTEEL